LVRSNAADHGLAKADQDWYASMTGLLQNFGAFFGIYGFGWFTGKVGRRPAFALAFLLAWGATVLTFGFMTRIDQLWWMAPLLGFCTLMVFGGYAIYFPELYPTRLRATGTGFCYNVARYLTAALLFAGSVLPTLFIAPAGTERASQGLSDWTFLSSLGSVDSPFRYAALTVASIYLLGLLVLPFAPETKGKPLPQ
jgi:MFS family permease